MELLSERFEIPRSRVTIVAGDRSRDKVVRLDGVTAAAVRSRVGLT